MLRKVFVVVVVVVTQQNRVTPSPFDFGLWTLDLDLDCDKYIITHTTHLLLQYSTFPLRYQAGGGSFLALPSTWSTVSCQCESSGGSGQTQPGLCDRAGQDQHVQIQRSNRGSRSEEEHDGDDEEGESDEPVSDVAVSVRSETPSE